MRSAFSLNAIAVVFVTCLGSSASAGIIPWTYNAIFGYGPAFPGGYYGAPAYPAYPATPLPTATYYGPVGPAWGSGIAAGYGSYGDCCNPCPAPCDPCSTCGSPCGPGGCPSGNCGSNYVPEASDDPNSPQPTEVTPEGQPTPPTYQNDPPPDNFVPAVPREEDTRPNRSSIPNARPAPDSVLPETNRPNTNGNSNAPGFNDSDFTLPNTERSPAPSEPSGSPMAPEQPDEVLPFGTGIQPPPLELESVPVASISPPRQRIVSQAHYRIPRVVRIDVTPASPEQSRLASK